MQIKVKRLDPTAKIPTRSRNTDAGWDLYATQRVRVNGGSVKVVPTGIALEIPEGYFGLLKPRSGFAVGKESNITAGVIDSSYRGEILLAVLNVQHAPIDVIEGDRIAQIIILKLPTTTMVEVEELSETDRGSQGFGSSGQ